MPQNRRLAHGWGTVHCSWESKRGYKLAGIRAHLDVRKEEKRGDNKGQGLRFRPAARNCGSSSLGLDSLVATLLAADLVSGATNTRSDAVLGPDCRPGRSVSHDAAVSRVERLGLCTVDLLLLLAVDHAVVGRVRVLHRTVGHALEAVVHLELVAVLASRTVLNKSQVVVVQAGVHAHLDAQLAHHLERMRLARLLVDVVALERAQVVASHEIELQIHHFAIRKVAERRNRYGIRLATERSNREASAAQVEREQRAVAVVHGQAHQRLLPSLNVLVRVDLLGVVASGHLDLLLLELLVALDLDLGQQLDSGSIPSEQRLGQLRFDAAEDQTSMDLAEADTVLEGEGLGHLGRLAEEFGEVDGHDAHDGVVLAQTGVSNGQAHLGLSPVADEGLGTRLVEGHVGVLLDASLVYDVVVDDELDIAAGECLTFARRGVHVLTVAALAFLAHDALLDVAVLEARDVVHDDAQNTRRVLRVGRAVKGRGLLRRVDGRGLALRLLFDLCHFLLLLLGHESLVEVGLFVEGDLPLERAGHVVGVLKAHELVLAVLRMVGVAHEVLERLVDAADNVVGGACVRVPELDGERLVGANVVLGDKQEGRLLPDRVEILKDDARAVERAAELGKREHDVRVALAVGILGAEAFAVLDLDDKHTNGVGVLLDAVAREHLCHVERHALGSHIHVGGGGDGGLDEARDEGEVEHVGKCLEHGDGRDLDLGHAHETEGEVADVRRLLNHLATQADRSRNVLDLDPDGQRDLEEIVGTDEELDHEMDVGGAVLVRLARTSRVAEGDFVVEEVARLVFVGNAITIGVLVGIERLLGVALLVLLVVGDLFALGDPFLARIFLVAHHVGETAHGDEAERVVSDANVVDLDRIDKAGERLLHDVLDHVGHGHKHVWVDLLPDASDGGVEPFDALGHRGRQLLSALLVHLGADRLVLLFDFARLQMQASPAGEANGSDDGGAQEEPPPAVTEGDEEPDDGKRGAKTDGELIEGGLHALHSLGVDGLGEAVEEDVGGLGRVGRSVKRVVLGRIFGNVG
ncbi:hypothetical protein L1887_60519 [Cichorium endivia]|nr:hypothetical protein L1887_60519 [Cichorium endivia]